MKSMDFMNVSVERAVDVIKKHQQEFNNIRENGSQLSYEEIAQKMIIDAFGDAQIEAEETVTNFKQGLSHFDAQFNINKESESINVKDYLNEATDGCSDEQRQKYYVNILTAIQLLDSGLISEDEVKAKIAENTNLSVEELLVKIEASLNNTISLETLATKVKDGFTSDTLSQIAHEIELHKNDYRLIAAVYLYIEQRKGDIQLSDSEIDMPAETVGALAGAAIEMLLANNALHEGKIDLATWQKVVKWILGAAIAITLGAAVLVITASTAVLAISLLLGILGTSTLAVAFSFIAVCYVCWHISEGLIDIGHDFMKMCSSVYDEYIGVITEKVSKWIAVLKKWFNIKTDEAKKALNQDEERDTQDSLQTDNNVSEIPLQIAKAKEIQEKMVEVFNRMSNEHKSLQDIIREDLQKTGKWDLDQINTIIENLQRGIESYHTQRNQSANTNDVLTLEQLEEILSTVPVEQQKDKLIAILSIFTFVQDTDADITKLSNDWELMSIDALKDLIVAHANKNDIYDNVINQLKDNIIELNLSNLNMPEQFCAISDDYKLYVATQIFIEADHLDAQNIEQQAQSIGATSAAAVDIARETMRWQNGEISEKTWHSIVKVILAVLAVCVISLILLFVATELLLSIFSLFTAIFGFSMISVIIGLILGYAFFAGFLFLLYKGFDAVVDDDLMENMDASLETFLCKIDKWITKVKEKCSEIWKKLQVRFIGKDEQIGEDQQEAQVNSTSVDQTPIEANLVQNNI